MVSYYREFRCDVITPEGSVFTGELTAARFPAQDGLVGVLGGRGPLVMLLGSGPFSIRQTSGEEALYFVAGGFARFQNNALTILAEQCQLVRDIDPEEAWKDIVKAQGLPLETPEQKQIREESLEAARNKFNMAQRYKQETGEG
jgi:F-type H+-transporting ATPase subunit epsilon